MQYKAILSIFSVTTALAAASEESTIDPVLESLLTYPTWVVEAIDSAEPTAWASSFRYDDAFYRSVALAEAEGTMPAWYNSLPESVKRFESTREAAIISYELTASQDSLNPSTSYAIATATATTGAATSTASSSSNGAGGPNSAGGAIMRIAGAAGALGLGFIFAL
ncbi:hypothetical protein N7451_006065 [Penicillium sp. IBT 35674x]|nr:hypothetical protein N7451_006065 [Penicillium sp. IBT 35674x]